AAPAPALAEEDPLMHLFDGEMELPEAGGEALGSLLGDEGGGRKREGRHVSAGQTPLPLPLPGPPAPARAPLDGGDLDLEMVEAPPRAVEPAEAAKIEIEDDFDGAFGEESTRVASAGEVDALLDDDQAHSPVGGSAQTDDLEVDIETTPTPAPP